MKKILAAHDWLDLHLLDLEHPSYNIWDNWIEKVGVKHAREGAWTFQGKMLLITLETDGDTVIYLCDEYELETGDVFSIIYEARQEEGDE